MKHFESYSSIILRKIVEINVKFQEVTNIAYRCHEFNIVLQTYEQIIKWEKIVFADIKMCQAILQQNMTGKKFNILKGSPESLRCFLMPLLIVKSNSNFFPLAVKTSA
jgi:hypothetical protein